MPRTTSPWKKPLRKITSETLSVSYLECGHGVPRAYNAFGPVRGREHAGCEECGKAEYFANKS